MGHDWYCIITNPQCERKAAGELRRAGLRVYLPKRTYEHVHKRSGSKVTKYRPLWTGYLLIRFPQPGAAPFAIARSCQGVKDFLKWTTDSGEWEPVPIPEKIVLAYMRRQRNRDYDGVRAARTEREKRREKFKPGSQVRLHDGPFAGFLARIDRIKGETAWVVADLFGRETPVVVDSFVDRMDLHEEVLDVGKEAA